jgi:FkbM family methyltransferase
VIVYDPLFSPFVTPGGNIARMHYRRDTNDYNTVRSCIHEDEYSLPSGLAGTAVDVGGHVGSVSIALALDNPDLQVIAVEPVPDNCVLFERNILQNKVEDRVKLLRGAVGEGTVRVRYGFRGTENATHHAFIGNALLVTDDAPGEVVEYRGTTLTELVDWADGHIVWMKVDTEGAEWSFLACRDVQYVDTIVGEWHPTEGHKQGDITRLLRKTHDVTFTGPEAGPGGFRAVRR